MRKTILDCIVKARKHLTMLGIVLPFPFFASASNTLASVNDLASSAVNMNTTAITANETCNVSQNNGVFE